MTIAMNAGLERTRMVVAVPGSAFGECLADALMRRGARPTLICDQPGDGRGGYERLVADFASRGALEQAFAKAEDLLGGINLLIHAALPDLLMDAQPLNEMDDARWQESCEAALTASFHCLQAAHGPLAKHGGMLIQLGASPALTGASGLVALCTAAEAQRGLAKAAARQWGADGIRVNWMALAAEVVSPLLAKADLPKKSEAIPVPLGERPGFDDVIAMIESLAGDAGKRITGLSLNLDGGEWMLP